MNMRPFLKLSCGESLSNDFLKMHLGGGRNFNRVLCVRGCVAKVTGEKNIPHNFETLLCTESLFFIKKRNITLE